MGRGNWFPGRTETPRVLAYVDLSASDDELRDDDGTINENIRSMIEEEKYNDFRMVIASLLPDSFSAAVRDSWQCNLWNSAYGWRDSNVWAYNRQTALVSDPEGENFHMGFALCPLPLHYSDYLATQRQYPMAVHNTERMGTRIFDKLHKMGYKLSVRTGAYTSDRYMSVQEVVASRGTPGEQ